MRIKSVANSSVPVKLIKWNRYVKCIQSTIKKKQKNSVKTQPASMGARSTNKTERWERNGERERERERSTTIRRGRRSMDAHNRRPGAGPRETGASVATSDLTLGRFCFFSFTRFPKILRGFVLMNSISHSQLRTAAWLEKEFNRMIHPVSIVWERSRLSRLVIKMNFIDFMFNVSSMNCRWVLLVLYWVLEGSFECFLY